MSRYSISLMTDAQILKNSAGEVTSSSLYDHRRDRPSFGGLYCERIFGPLQHFCCSCGQLQGLTHKGKRCRNCQVECLPKTVRDTREAHLDTYTWYINPRFYKPIAELLGMNRKTLTSIIDLNLSVRLEPINYHLKPEESNSGVFINSEGYECTLVHYQVSDWKQFGEIITGTEALKNCIDQIDSDETFKYHIELGSTLHVKWYNAGYKYTDLFNRYLLIKPVGVRPLNIGDDNSINVGFSELYLRVMRAVFQLRYVKENDTDSSEVVSVQMGHSRLVNTLVDSMHKGGVQTRRGQSISGTLDDLSGKDGLIRESLLGKRVDFSGRSVIVGDPKLRLGEVGVPYGMMIELLTPHILNELTDWYGYRLSDAKSIVKMHRDSENEHPLIKYCIERIMKRRNSPMVLLNRAPSLHRLSVGALTPKITYGKMITIHPLICAAYNADFDGDQMAVHLVLSDESRQEAVELLSVGANLLSSASGAPTFSLSHEMIVGVYYLSYIPDNFTTDHPPLTGTDANKIVNEWEMINISYGNKLSVHHPVKYRINGQWIDTTVGRLILAKETMLDKDYAFVSTTLNQSWNKNVIQDVLKYVIMSLDQNDAIRVHDNLMDIGFQWATRMGLTISYDDTRSPSTFSAKILEGESFEGNEEDTARNWAAVTESLVDDWLSENSDLNPLKLMYQTKSRVSSIQLRQMNIMKGLIASPKGGLVLIKNSLHTGLNPFEYLLTCKGTRMSLGANHEVVPQSGYLTRQLVSAGRELVVESDQPSMNTEFGLMVDPEDAVGRFEFGTNLLITEDIVHTKSQWEIQSPVTGYGPLSIYELGVDPSTAKIQRTGSHPGIIGGQSLGEKGTQLGLRSKHLSGAVKVDSSNMNVVVAAKSGKVSSIEDTNRFSIITVDDHKYYVHKLARSINVKVGQKINEGHLIATYDSNLQGADISSGIAQIMKLIGANNPGKSFNMPTSIVSPYSGKVSYVLEKVGDEYDYNSDLIELNNSIRSARFEDGTLVGPEKRPDPVYIKSDYSNEVLHIYVDGEYIGTASEVTAIQVPDGATIKAGTKLMYGLSDIFSVYSATKDVRLLWKIMYAEMKNVMSTNGVVLNSIHYEMVLRSMLQLRYDDTTDEYVIAQDGSGTPPDLTSITQVPLRYPNLLKSISFGYIGQQIDKACYAPVTYDSSHTVKLLMGKLIDSPAKGGE